MTIKEQENSLFSDWRKTRKGFVADGVADEDAYAKSHKKILFIMKEANDPDGGGWDLREFMRQGGRPATWNNITRWVEGIRALTGDIPADQREAITQEQRRIDAVRTIAAMNLKKTPGGGTANHAAIQKVATEDGDYLSRQFGIYDADIVICCGATVGDLAYLCIKSPVPWKMTKNMVRYHEYKPGKYLISYSHPAARGRGRSSKQMLDRLMDAIREIGVWR